MKQVKLYIFSEDHSICTNSMIFSSVAFNPFDVKACLKTCSLPQLLQAFLNGLWKIGFYFYSDLSLICTAIYSGIV